MKQKILQKVKIYIIYHIETLNDKNRKKSYLR